MSLFAELAPVLTELIGDLTLAQSQAELADDSEETLRLRGYALGLLAGDLGLDLLGDRFEPRALEAVFDLAVRAADRWGVRVVLDGRLPLLVPGPEAQVIARLSAALVLEAARRADAELAVQVERDPAVGVLLLVRSEEAPVLEDGGRVSQVVRDNWQGLAFPLPWFEETP